MSKRVTFELIATAAIVIVSTWAYMLWYGDVVASFVGYHLAVFAVPLAAGIIIGVVSCQILCTFAKDPRKLRQFSGVGAISALVLPVFYLWALSQPH